MTTSNFTPKCLEFAKLFHGKQGVTAHQSENIEQHYFSGAIYIKRLEFVCLEQLNENEYMVYINNPTGHPEQQWVFGYYKTWLLRHRANGRKI